MANFDKRPWVIFDYKVEEAINSIDRAERIDVGYVPKHPGLYVVNPLPTDTEIVDAYLTAIWDHEKIGLYFDEGYMIPNDAGLVACLTQGRSKQIPAIMLTQRPVSISRFAFSEANFFQVFSMIDVRDKQTVKGFAPINFNVRLPEFSSFYYDVGKDRLNIMLPVPPQDITLDRIDNKLSSRAVRRRI